MSNFKISVPVPGARAAQLVETLAEVANADAVTAFEAEPGTWRLEVYFGAPPDLAGFTQLLDALDFPPNSPLQAQEIVTENWVAKVQARLAPVTAGRFLVHGGHDRMTPRVAARGRRALLIDAGEAFGTAHHATTRGCLLALDALIKQRQFRSVLDIGTGAGTLAIAAALGYPNAHVLASDIDPVAVWVAKANARLNGMGDRRIRFVTAAGLSHPHLRRQQAELVFANILAAPLMTLAPGITAAVASRGTLVLSGLLCEQANAVLAAYRARGLVRVRRLDLDGWSTLILRRAGISRSAHVARLRPKRRAKSRRDCGRPCRASAAAAHR